MPMDWGKTCIVLIPKKDCANRVSDFRPISLCNVCYKIISKILTNRLKPVIHKLIGPEQNGFLAGKSTFDNIIAVQEIVHSLETDTQHPPRMLIKVDIEKAYDAMEWEAILATLKVMNFTEVWISWIRACIISPSFSFIINGQPSDWITPARGVRQRDPISPYLFLLVSQNLSSMLNHAMGLNMVPGFDHRLNRNLNHLMFADDLIIITRASRRDARNCSLCLDIYKRLISP